jgi:hypothetical protein
MHFAPWVGPANLLEEVDEFGVAVVLIAGVGEDCRSLPSGRRRLTGSVARGQHNRGPASRHQQRVCDWGDRRGDL